MFALFSVFSRASESKAEPKSTSFRTLSAYTGLFFALVILHRTLRSQYQLGKLLYIEYFFFFTYIGILILVLHAGLLQIYRGRANIIMKLFDWFQMFFWPIQLSI